MVRFGGLDKDAETTDSGNWKPQTPSRKLQPRYVRQNVVIPTPPLIPAPKHLLRLQELDSVQCDCAGLSFAERSRGKGADSGSRHRIRETPPTCHRIRLWLQKETRKKTRRGVTRDPLLVP